MTRAGRETYTVGGCELGWLGWVVQVSKGEWGYISLMESVVSCQSTKNCAVARLVYVG